MLSPATDDVSTAPAESVAGRGQRALFHCGVGCRPGDQAAGRVPDSLPGQL